MSVVSPAVPIMIGARNVSLGPLTIGDFISFEKASWRAAEEQANKRLARLVRFECSTVENRKAIVDELDLAISTSRAEALFTRSYEGLAMLVWLAAHDPSLSLEDVYANIQFRDMAKLRETIDDLSLPPVDHIGKAKAEAKARTEEAPNLPNGPTPAEPIAGEVNGTDSSKGSSPSTGSTTGTSAA